MGVPEALARLSGHRADPGIDVHPRIPLKAVDDLGKEVELARIQQGLRENDELPGINTILACTDVHGHEGQEQTGDLAAQRRLIERCEIVIKDEFP